MSGARRCVSFSRVVQEGVSEQDTYTETYGGPTDSEVKKRSKELREEKDRFWQSQKEVDAIVALGQAALLRAEVELYIGDATGARSSTMSGLHQAADSRGAQVTNDKTQSLDAEDIEDIMSCRQMLFEVETCMKDMCVGIGVQTQLIAETNIARRPWSASGSSADIVRVATIDEPCVPRDGDPDGVPRGHVDWTAGKRRVQNTTLPPILRPAVAITPSKPETTAPAKSRPRPPPPPRKRSIDDRMTDHNETGSMTSP
eukprot:TRINITY_DN1597_c0_g1_i3.p1 TRINITY_DN1597_c0_g1~~TRINITY_DN1597_c0_g1_i3.p1  ORF type:complete len:286 (+),score=32.34 TRINITY_DN1597_c0_g1_i3:90-860(+)